MTLRKAIILYEHTGKILAVKKHKELENLKKQYYFMRFGEKIGQNDNGTILFDAFAHRYIETDSILRYQLQDEEELDRYLR